MSIGRWSGEFEIKHSEALPSVYWGKGLAIYKLNTRKRYRVSIGKRRDQGRKEGRKGGRKKERKERRREG